MSIKINYTKNTASKLSSNLVLFADEKFNNSTFRKYITKTEFSYIYDLLKTSDLKKNMFVYEVNSKKKIVLISIKKDLKSFDIENLGSEFYGRINYEKNSEYYINSDSIIGKQENFLSQWTKIKIIRI